MKEIVFDDIVSRFDEHIVKFVRGICIGVSVDLFDFDQFVEQVGGIVVPVGMP